jgi:hypothetical protein
MAGCFFLAGAITRILIRDEVTVHRPKSTNNVFGLDPPAVMMPIVSSAGATSVRVTRMRLSYLVHACLSYLVDAHERARRCVRH